MNIVWEGKCEDVERLVLAKREGAVAREAGEAFSSAILNINLLLVPQYKTECLADPITHFCGVQNSMPYSTHEFFIYVEEGMLWPDT